METNARQSISVIFIDRMTPVGPLRRFWRVAFWLVPPPRHVAVGQGGTVLNPVTEGNELREYGPYVRAMRKRGCVVAVVPCERAVGIREFWSCSQPPVSWRFPLQAIGVDNSSGCSQIVGRVLRLSGVPVPWWHARTPRRLKRWLEHNVHGASWHGTD